MFRMTIRATDDSVPPLLVKIMEERLSLGYFNEPERSQAGGDDTGSYGDLLV